MNNEKINFTEITPVPEIIADKRRVCEIRFDCLVTMHDVGYKRYKGLWGQEKESKTPQWFRANHIITLEGVKHADPYELGIRIKQMFQQLEDTINKYERGIN
jgi:hypothetical protein